MSLVCIRRMMWQPASPSRTFGRRHRRTCGGRGQCLRKDGSRFPAKVHLTAIRGLDDRLEGFGQIIRDTTERAEFGDGESRLRSLIATVLDTVVDGLITIDRRGHIQSFNKACTILFGYEPDEVLGENIRILMPESKSACKWLIA